MTMETQIHAVVKSLSVLASASCASLSGIFINSSTMSFISSHYVFQFLLWISQKELNEWIVNHLPLGVCFLNISFIILPEWDIQIQC